jgi:hypothetical protein
MEDLVAPPDSATRGHVPPEFHVSSAPAPGGGVRIRLVARGAGAHTFMLRADNLEVERPARRVALRAGRESVVEWTGRVTRADTPWVAVIVADGDAADRRELFGPHR